jgi:flavin-dependent dehydrogenase
VADGLAGGSLTDLPEFGWTIAEASRFGAGAVVDATGDAPPHGDLRMLLDSIGYLGIVRLPDDRVDLAAAFHASAVRRVGGPAEAAARLLERHAMPALAAEARSARWQGTPTLTRRRRRVAAGPIACIGDAAGYVEPFTGEGMTWAMRSGVEVATFIDAALATGQSLDGWNTRHRRLFARHHRRCRLVARTVRHPGLIHHGAALLSRIAPIRTALPRYLTGATGATGAIRGTPVRPDGDA